MGGMNRAPAARPQARGFTSRQYPCGVRRGYVTADQPVFRVVNTDQVWAVSRRTQQPPAAFEKASPSDCPRKRYYPTPARDGWAGGALLPEWSEYGYRPVSLPNPGGGCGAACCSRAELAVKTDSGLWAAAGQRVLDLGNRQVAFVRQGQHPGARAVEAGLRNGDWIEVVQGPHRRGCRRPGTAQYLVRLARRLYGAAIDGRPKTWRH
jgi:hypothetical protein